MTIISKCKVSSVRICIFTATSVCASIGLLAGCGGASSSAGTAASPSCSALVGSKMLQGAGGSGSGSTTAGALAGTPGHKVLNGHVLKAVSQSSDLGKFDESTELPVTLSLKVNQEAALAQELFNIYNPTSPSYGHYLSPDEFRTRFAPTDDQISQVTTYLEQGGFRSISVDRNGLLVHAIGNVGKINSAFGTEIHHYADSKNREYYSPNAEPQIPEGLQIQGVHGIQSYTQFHTHLQQRPASKTASGAAVAHAGSGPNSGYSPSDIHTAYNIGSSQDGTGQTLALFELDGYNASDIAAYEKQFSLPATPLQNVLIDGASGTPGSGVAEVTLDIELMIAVAPKASKIIVYEGPNNDQGMLDVYSKIANDNLAQSVSTSWGNSEDSSTASFLQAENTIFMQMATQGQTIYSASGDTGADDNGSSLSVDDPSSQPYVVAVGGTTLVTNSGGAYGSETTWNDSSGAGGGGVSTVWTIPNWQSGVINAAASKGSTTMRNIPDVALHADISTGYAIYSSGSWGVWGGTSCAAPIWAAFNALVNQARAASGMGPVGYITPMLYSLGQGSRYASDFHDIANGSTNGYYPAIQGYDDATGWGSFNGSNLLQDLSTPPQSLGTTVLPTSSPSSSGGACSS